MSGRQQRVMLQPINVIFRHLQQQTRVSLWLYDNIEYRIEGKIIGFDEFMNVTLAEAEEVPCSAEKARKPLGRLLLKGDNIVRMEYIDPAGRVERSRILGSHE
ncbi:Similar to S.cerevisiae protein SME1 (Core Sm protein Sm E) [Malassezia sympodialis ATCC 42132]|uniref:Small nuclear ribonucleoprotein E n=1 Tax=Malassezia sympodialis (strain ATCC 42132) TaxID=1230383 RepID=A0A1M8A4N9_MALS4|nr:Similar to S.cerevisiae protein SME1 (Core Sm protein Sm E) [Malassezia sympodialis ATCC 42132]